jgi:hypothetical protein
VYGRHVWVVQRCGQNSCDSSNDDPIIEFDMNGKPIKSFGAGLFVSPHGLTFDKTGNFYVADYQGKPGKGPGGVQVQPKWQDSDDAGDAGRGG